MVVVRGGGGRRKFLRASIKQAADTIIPAWRTFFHAAKDKEDKEDKEDLKVISTFALL